MLQPDLPNQVAIYYLIKYLTPATVEMTDWAWAT